MLFLVGLPSNQIVCIILKVLVRYFLVIATNIFCFFENQAQTQLFFSNNKFCPSVHSKRAQPILCVRFSKNNKHCFCD